MARVTKFYDLSWTFADGHTVTFAGVSRIADLRRFQKDLKRKPGQSEYAKRLTNKAFHISDHAHCPQCQPCPTCRRPLHVCDGHEDA